MRDVLRRHRHVQRRASSVPAKGNQDTPDRIEDVEGKTVTVAFISSATEFDEFAPVAQKVIDSVEWRSS